MQRTRTSTGSATGRSGFTLIELMAVILILSILITFLVRSVGGGQQAMEVQSTKALLAQIEGIIAEYHDAHEAYPPSTFDPDLDPRPSTTNMGSESLVITLWRNGAKWQAREIDEKHLGNTDGDTTKTSLTTYTSPDAFELVDLWGNPIAYVHRVDYKKEFVYVTIDGAGGEYESRVKALVSSKTGDPYRKSSFQLVSAGPDGLFGTADDVANFDYERGD